MQTLTYGRKKPQTGDDSLGSTGWMQAVENNVALDDAHNHNGVNSPKLDSSSINAYTTTTGTGWGAIGNGLYEITVTVPAAMDFDKCQIFFKTAAGQQVFLDVLKINASSFKVKTNDNTANYTVLFIS